MRNAASDGVVDLRDSNFFAPLAGLSTGSRLTFMPTTRSAGFMHSDCHAWNGRGYPRGLRPQRTDAVVSLGEDL